MAKKKASARVTDRGQVTIPGDIRRRLGIVPGTTLQFHTEGGKLVALKETVDDPVSRVFGSAGALRTDKVMAELRGGR